MANPIPTRATVQDSLPTPAEPLTFGAQGGPLAPELRVQIAVAKVVHQDGDSRQGAIAIMAVGGDGAGCFGQVTVASARVLAAAILQACAEIDSGNLDP